MSRNYLRKEEIWKKIYAIVKDSTILVSIVERLSVIPVVITKDWQDAIVGRV